MMALLILLLCFLSGIGVTHLLIRRSAPWVAAWVALSGFGVAAVLLRCPCGWAAFRSRHGDG